MATVLGDTWRAESPAHYDPSGVARDVRPAAAHRPSFLIEAADFLVHRSSRTASNGPYRKRLPSASVRGSPPWSRVDAQDQGDDPPRLAVSNGPSEMVAIFLVAQ